MHIGRRLAGTAESCRTFSEFLFEGLKKARIVAEAAPVADRKYFLSRADNKRKCKFEPDIGVELVDAASVGLGKAVLQYEIVRAEFSGELPDRGERFCKIMHDKVPGFGCQQIGIRRGFGLRGILLEDSLQLR